MWCIVIKIIFMDVAMIRGQIPILSGNVIKRISILMIDPIRVPIKASLDIFIACIQDVSGVCI